MKYEVKFILSLGILILMTFTNLASQREHINMDEDWKFHFGNAANPEKDFSYGLATIYSKSGGAFGTAIDSRFEDSAWRSLDLPHDWAVELPFVEVDNFQVNNHGFKPVGGLFPETSIGWYRKHFTVDKKDSIARFQIQFDGIFRDANIWVNGFFVGNNKSGYIGASYDITDFINFDRENSLVVRVDATQYEGWFYEGAGIYRHVWLNTYNNTHIATDGIFASAAIQNNKATINIETTLTNENASFSLCTVSAYFLDRDGKELGRARDQIISLPSQETKSITQSIQVINPRLWSLDDPYLHRIVVELKSGTQVIDKKIIRFGVRSIEIKANSVLLNGKPIKLLGTNNHQDHAGVGSALPDYLQYYRISLLKNMGVNSYRTSHHAPTPELLDACDSLGMLVLDETRLLNSSVEYLDQFERLVKRDRSRASVFMWSIGNEEGWIHTNDYGKKIAQTFINKLMIWDPTRTCTYAADLANVYKGINEVIPVRSFNYRQFGVAAYHKDHPNQPIIGTEMGSTLSTRGIVDKDSIRGYLPDQDITFPWWASKAETWWPLAAENDFWLGGYIWTGFDYRGETTPFRWPNVSSHFGVMDVCGFPKNLYYYYQSWWTDKDVLHISPHWNLRDKRGQQVEVWVNSNADSVELFLNNKSQGIKIMQRNSHLTWDVKYEPGVLKALGYKKGKMLESKIETTDAPAEVVITPYKTTTLANGGDVTIINVHVIDRAGREVPDAENLIKFSLQGDAKIIGVGNGDPSSHEPDKCLDGAWERHLFNGKCQVIVQAGRTPGIVKFEAKSTGLWTASTDIIMVDPDKPKTGMRDPAYDLKGSAVTVLQTSKMLGADISFLPQLEDRGIKFSENGVEKDAIQILKEHGINYVRLRIFNEPARDSGYSPQRGFCDLNYTKQMAKRVKAAGLKLLLDFHYSDYWADPGKQYKPYAWRGLSFNGLKKAMYDYTKKVITELKKQGTTPDMVQIGNEINHGIIWPDGNITELDQLAELLRAGTAAVKETDPNIIMMLHVALGGQNNESVFFIDNMLARGVHFDVIGESYYPKWHGTLEDLRDNLNDLARRYDRDIIVVEYSQLKNEVNKIAFEVQNGKGKGTCIWEPLSTWESVFEHDGKANDQLKKYDEISKMYLNK